MGHQANPEISPLYNVLGPPQCFLSVGHAQNTTPRRPTTRHPNPRPKPP